MQSHGSDVAVELNGSAEPIEFIVEGSRIRGTFYMPANAQGPVPAVVFAHGWSMVAGGDLEDYAASAVNAGFAALTFDFRNLGKSEGLPRQEIDPHRQVEDFRSAISYIRSRPEVNREKIGIWGSSYSGGHALYVAAIDKRVKCVVAQVPTISGFLAAQRRVSGDKAAALRLAFEADREARLTGAAPATILTVDADPNARVAYPGIDSYSYMTGEAARCPEWVNEITLRSLELARTYEPGVYIKRIAPTPLLMIAATEDALTPSDMQQEAFQQALEPKKLMLVPGGHYVVYREYFDKTSSAATAWFAEHLLG
ncbi:alpha/beta hydrolase [Pseudochrobactrum sp. sp1633]|uniref:alpha/beta hydrolase n=1 Tax=Pseudochrobactrum sp. sp1633 TaxID=3036706 RepID=UPI0025A590D5|nr:alpha/beta hydrolase [Pseudochrobactrum sp. sp1633]MDM8345880.1 alpha/beta hydrolase [Pseudochrobactrum sp. sp1633]HWD12262.1 alpha/beta hydrolase [Pseudochrobactrum sp.]